MRSADEIASKAGLLCKPFIGGAYPKGCGSSCSCTHAIDAITTIQREAIEAAAKVAKVAWLKTPCGTIGDADHDNELCEFVEASILALLPAPAREEETT